ncbi:P-loop NTPase [Kribbella pittospori]|uniref:nucleotide-binding protein n=1 Tax=Kribbella pittospori TaxID=722689 RepID=UPI0013F3F10D|nr:P-loop NTPase [Kribbella pittospori]
MSAQALLLSGGGGVGKTTVAQAIARLLTGAGHPTAVVDLDAVGQFGPKPPGAEGALGAAPDSGLRFHDRLKARNLAAVWPTYRDVGARFLIVSGHVETAELKAAYTQALADCDVRVVRVLTPPDLVAARTRSTRGPDWDLQAALAEAAAHQPIEDFTVSNDGSPAETAAEILGKAGWPVG